VRLPRLSLPAYRRLALATLVALVAITVVGAAVRLTGSGLGCSTWPSCEAGSFAPRSASDTHAVIEFTNRLANVGIGLLTVATVVGARLVRPRRDDLVRWALGVLAWVAGNGLVGAVVVWLELTPLSVIGHFVLSLGAIWNALWLYDRAGRQPPAPAAAPGAAPGSPPPQAPVRVRAATARLVAATRVLVAVSGVVLLTGTVVTGSGPHAGDQRADRLDLDVGAVARVHGVTVIVFLALAVAVAHLAHRGEAVPVVADRSRALVAVLVAQAAIGYWQYFAGVPALLVAFHVLGSALVWVAVLRLWLALTPGEAGAAAPPAPRTPAGARPAGARPAAGPAGVSRAPTATT
jgi:cytochrome c oxidase assembly protein subunit 15